MHKKLILPRIRIQDAKIEELTCLEKDVSRNERKEN
jgi:hypothetical protein